jgi:hypothetical protein
MAKRHTMERLEKMEGFLQMPMKGNTKKRKQAILPKMCQR